MNMKQHFKTFTKSNVVKFNQTNTYVVSQLAVFNYCIKREACFAKTTFDFYLSQMTLI